VGSNGAEDVLLQIAKNLVDLYLKALGWTYGEYWLNGQNVEWTELGFI